MRSSLKQARNNHADVKARPIAGPERFMLS
jgi:hypothetical protein